MLILLIGFGVVAVVSLALLVVVLARYAKLARADAAKTRFVATLSHEVRTPLTAVIGFAELMRHGRAGRISETQREYLAIVGSSGDHLLGLVNDALDLATIEAGQLRLRPETIEPAQVAGECAASLRALATDAGVTIDYEQANLGPIVLDPGRLRQVILNYVSNAIKYSQRGGHVTLRVARERDRLTIAVSDAGIGIPAGDQERVFEAFTQLGEWTRPGSGLGLAVTRQIVEALGGKVAVRSRVGAGSTFTAWLPWMPPSVAPRNAEPVPTAATDSWNQLAAELVRR